jgi:hypothetical protein
VDDNDVGILGLTYGAGWLWGQPLGGAVGAADVPGAVGGALPMSDRPALMTPDAIQSESRVEDADLLAYAQATRPRQAPLMSAGAAGGAYAVPPALLARSGTYTGSAFLPSGDRSAASDPPLRSLTAPGTPLAWSTAEEVAPAPGAVLSPDGGVEGLLLMPALGVSMR